MLYLNNLTRIPSFLPKAQHPYSHLTSPSIFTILPSPEVDLQAHTAHKGNQHTDLGSPTQYQTETALKAFKIRKSSQHTGCGSSMSRYRNAHMLFTTSKICHQ